LTLKLKIILNLKYFQILKLLGFYKDLAISISAWCPLYDALYCRTQSGVCDLVEHFLILRTSLPLSRWVLRSNALSGFVWGLLISSESLLQFCLLVAVRTSLVLSPPWRICPILRDFQVSLLQIVLWAVWLTL